MKFEKWFFSHDGSQKKWFVVFGVFLPIVLTLIFSFWGIKLSIDSSNNREQIDTLSNLIKKSQQQIDFLQKIYVVSDSTNRAASRLKQLPEKISLLSSTLDTLNITLANESRKLGKSYSQLNSNYDVLLKQQKDYLDKISGVVELTNQQITELKANNALINQEFSRRAAVFVTGKIKITGGVSSIESFELFNLGKIEIDIETIDFEFLNNDFVCDKILETGSDPDLLLLSGKTFRINNRGVNKNRVSVGRGLSIRFQHDCYSKTSYLVKYSLTYSNKYENTTVNGYVDFISK